jgi:Flp pilus assembly secretin CpaC
MRRRRLIPTASLVAVIAAVGFVATDRAPAAEPHIADMQVISSDATARYVALGVGKAFVIDLVGDIKDVLVANPTIADAVMQTNHRAYIIGKGLGQTNVYFFDADRRQIGALDVSVSTDPRPLDILGSPVVVSNVITVYLGAINGYSISCTPRCKRPTPTPETAPTQIIETHAR